ncbi:GlmU family protein [Leeuwenhoekiella sp. MAR_2009_132]|uniref:GlmU family protein n=1 Tax=Leeuwenhoekiella sp. MAR_2009_132 TaxID=1392489 RepID=UPI000491623A|nr:GlmU family protein [Leeuwenhoekiella sp. MAR_2009_132]
MNYILFDGPVRNQLLPLTFTRPVADLRIGILTIREKWEKHLGSTTSTVTEEYLADKYPMVEFENNIMINAAYIPTSALLDSVFDLRPMQALFDGEDVVAFYTQDTQEEIDFDAYEQLELDQKALFKIEHTWDLFSKNHKAIQLDYELLTEERESLKIPKNVQVTNPGNIFIEEGAKVNFCSLNASEGPIFIGKDAEIMEGALIRGPFALCEGAIVKMGAKIYTGTTIGPYCKVGGEINNSVLMAYSNKGHDGFLGNSVLGEWCNIGADSNNSNLKNNYEEVRVWDYETEGFAKTGLQFCGLIMGDHSKCGINTMFNTGTVIGVSVNIFGPGFPRNFVPSFSWGGASGFTTYKTEKAFQTAKLVTERRNIPFDEQEAAILEHVFEQTAKYRRY